MGAGCVQMSPAKTRGPHLAKIQFIVVEAFHADIESGSAMSVTVMKMQVMGRIVSLTNMHNCCLPFHLGR